MAEVEQVKSEVTSELQKLETAELNYQHLQEALNDDPKFQQFLTAQKQFNDLSATVWKNIETVMLENDITSIKTDKLTLSIATRTSFDVDLDLLPGKYIKRVPNTTLIGSEYKLTGKLVKGTSPKTTKYLVKRFKKED